MKEKTIDRIIEYLKINEKGAVVKMVLNFGVSKQVIHRKLKDLLSQGLIIKEGKAPKVSYSINKDIDRTISVAKVKKAILPILKKHGIKRAAIFGSLARGEQNKTSDVDILVELGKPMGYAFFGIQDEMENVLKRKVDLLTYKSVDPLLKNYILKDKKTIYG